MNLKLKVFDSKKRFENKKLAELENKMDHYFDEDIDETYQVGIILDYISEIEKIKKEDEKLLINGKQIKLIKKFEADILANGGLQSIKPGLLEKIMEAMTNIFELDFKTALEQLCRRTGFIFIAETLYFRKYSQYNIKNFFLQFLFLLI